MKNNTNIKGDKNIIVQGSSNPKVNVGHKHKNKSGRKIYSLIGIIIAVLGLIATIIIGWDNIINFFLNE